MERWGQWTGDGGQLLLDEAVVSFIVLLGSSFQLLDVHCDGVEKVSGVHHNTVVPLETDLRLEFGVRSHQVELGVNSHPMF